MGLVAEYEIICEQLPFVGVAAAVPEATLEIDIQPTQDDGYPPFIVHVVHETVVSVERAFESSAFVAEYTLVGRTNETHRYQILPAVGMEAQLGERIEDLSELHALATTDSITDRIRVTPIGWIQTGWFADRATLDEFRAFWRRNGRFRLRRLTRDGDGGEMGDELTDCQREAFLAAYEMGYFEIPRTTSLDDVAGELGITASSLSERLRRAQTHLAEAIVSAADDI